jgi:hypothetical protein
LIEGMTLQSDHALHKSCDDPDQAAWMPRREIRTIDAGTRPQGAVTTRLATSANYPRRSKERLAILPPFIAPFRTARSRADRPILDPPPVVSALLAFGGNVATPYFVFSFATPLVVLSSVTPHHPNLRVVGITILDVRQHSPRPVSRPRGVERG